MHQARQRLLMSQVGHVRARFAEPNASQADIPDLKLSSDEMVEGYPSSNHVPSCVTGLDPGPIVPLQGLDSLYLDECELPVRPGIIGVEPLLREVTVALESPPRNGLDLLDGDHRRTRSLADMDGNYLTFPHGIRLGSTIVRTGEVAVRRPTTDYDFLRSRTQMMIPTMRSMKPSAANPIPARTRRADEMATCPAA